MGFQFGVGKGCCDEDDENPCCGDDGRCLESSGELDCSGCVDSDCECAGICYSPNGCTLQTSTACRASGGVFGGCGTALDDCDCGLCHGDGYHILTSPASVVVENIGGDEGNFVDMVLDMSISPARLEIGDTYTITGTLTCSDPNIANDSPPASLDLYYLPSNTFLGTVVNGGGTLSITRSGTFSGGTLFLDIGDLGYNYLIGDRHRYICEPAIPLCDGELELSLDGVVTTLTASNLEGKILLPQFDSTGANSEQHKGVADYVLANYSRSFCQPIGVTLNLAIDDPTNPNAYAYETNSTSSNLPNGQRTTFSLSIGDSVTIDGHTFSLSCVSSNSTSGPGTIMSNMLGGGNNV